MRRPMSAGLGGGLFVVVVVGAGKGVDVDVVRPDRYDLGDAGDLLDEDALDAEAQSQHAHGAAVTGADHLQLHNARVAHVDDVHVAGVGVNVRPDFVQCLVNCVVEDSGFAHLVIVARCYVRHLPSSLSYDRAELSYNGDVVSDESAEIVVNGFEWDFDPAGNVDHLALHEVGPTDVRFVHEHDPI